jgi:hypothetical protein
MPSQPSIEELLTNAIASAVRKVIPTIQRHVADIAAAELERHLAVKGAGRAARATGRPLRSRVEMTKWVADNNARRVPKFVIEATGLDTKKKIVAKFGDNAAFEKGKPLPKASKAA